MRIIFPTASGPNRHYNRYHTSGRTAGSQFSRTFWPIGDQLGFRATQAG